MLGCVDCPDHAKKVPGNKASAWYDVYAIHFSLASVCRDTPSEPGKFPHPLFLPNLTPRRTCEESA
eukprot:scaffold1390_cov172-Amphora_coffeaeformis.AAC.12